MAVPVFSPVAPAAPAPTAPGPSGGYGVPGMPRPVPGFPGMQGSGPEPGSRSPGPVPGDVGPVDRRTPPGGLPFTGDLYRPLVGPKSFDPPPSPFQRGPNGEPADPIGKYAPWLKPLLPPLPSPGNPNNLEPLPNDGKDPNGNPLPSRKNAPRQGFPPELRAPSVGAPGVRYRVNYSYTIPGEVFNGRGEELLFGPIGGSVTKGRSEDGRNFWGITHANGFLPIVLVDGSYPDPVWVLSAAPLSGGPALTPNLPKVGIPPEPLGFVPSVPIAPPAPPPPFNDPKPFVRPTPAPNPGTPPPSPNPTSPPSPAPNDPPEPERKVPGPVPGPSPGPSKPSPAPSPGPSPSPSAPPNPKPTTFPPAIPADPDSPSVVPPTGPPLPTVPAPPPGVPSKPEPLTPIPSRFPDISPGSLPGQSPARDPGPDRLAPPGPNVSPGGNPPYDPNGKTKPVPFPFPVDNRLPPLPPTPDCCAIAAIDTSTERILKRINDAQESIEECACPVESKTIDLAPIQNLSSGTLQLPTGCVSVRMKLVSEDLNIRSEYGGGSAPDVKYVGWYSLSKTDGVGGDRKPISYGDQEVDVDPLHRYLTFTCKQSNRIDVYFKKRVPLDHVGDLTPLSAVPPSELLFKKSHT